MENSTSENRSDPQREIELIGIVQDITKDSDARVAAVKTLGKMQSQQAVLPLIQAAVSDPDYPVRVWSITALGDIGDKRATYSLIQILQEESPELRLKMHAAAALGQIRDNQAIEPLLRVLQNTRQEEVIRKWTAGALLNMDEQKVALPLLKYLKSDQGFMSSFRPINSSNNG